MGSRRCTDLREVLNALRYMVRSGCEWRMLPIHFPPWQTVYWWFRRFMWLFLFRTIHDVVAMIDRERAGRSAQPSAIVIDSQTVKAPAPRGSRGFDGGSSRGPAARRTIVWRKRHIAVDSPNDAWREDGRLLMVNLTTADISDLAGAQAILDGIRKRWPWIKHVFADGAYDRRKLMEKAALLDFTVEIVRRTNQGFVVLPRRWVIERTFGWMVRYRRLGRDYEARIDVSQAMINLAMANSILRRITHP